MNMFRIYMTNLEIYVIIKTDIFYNFYNLNTFLFVVKEGSSVFC